MEDFPAIVANDIHGGDLFYRSKIPKKLVDIVFEPIIEIADKGFPFFIVPGNHERSKIPVNLFCFHQNIHIFKKSETFLIEKNGLSVAIAGFPNDRNNIKKNFENLIPKSIKLVNPDIRLLCMHQTVEGAQVGPSDYTFRYGDDIIAGYQIPSGDRVLAVILVIVL